MAGTAIVEQVNGAVLEQRDGSRDDAIVAALVGGQTVRSVQRQFSLTTAQLDQALERAFPLDVAARLRTIRGDLAWLDGIIQKFYLRAMADGAAAADDAMVAIRAQERKAALLGLDAVQRVDLQVVQAPREAPTRYERITEAVMRIRSEPLPDPKRLNGGSPPDPDDDPMRLIR